MFNIDFSTLPNVTAKLAPDEIKMLNGLFQESSVQTRLEEIETQRKIRQKWKWAIYGGCATIALLLSYFVGGFTESTTLIGRLFSGFFFTIGEGDNSFDPVLWATVGSYALGIGTLYAKFASKIEIPLKSEVLSKICPLLYSKLEYSYDAKYSFDELEFLRSKQFLNSYDQIDTVEDSIHFTMEHDGKDFSLNGFELETSEIHGSGKNRKRVTTNHDYLMKVIFPHARIPLTSDLFIMKDTEETGGIGTKLAIPIFIAFFIGILSITLIGAFFDGQGLWLGGVIGVLGGYFMYRYQNKKSAQNRVKLENVEFEKLFDVKCEDQVTSRMILTPAFMDRIVRFVEKTGNQYEFLFQSNTLYIKRNIFGKYLEAGTEKNMLTNVAGFADFYSDMREIMMFAHDMNLMYLSNTDTTKQYETQDSTQVKPIVFDAISPKKSSLFGGFIPGFALKVLQ